MCWCSGNVVVSVCRGVMFVSAVQPVIIRSAVFCIVCSLFMFVCEAIGDQIVDAYSIIGNVMDLYVCRSVSLLCPQLLVVSCLSMFIVFSAF